MSNDSNAVPLALPLAPPPPEDEVEQLTVNGTQTFKFDKLGPVVVNPDGTLSRIANWEQMTPFEKERILRVLVARNKWVESHTLRSSMLTLTLGQGTAGGAGKGARRRRQFRAQVVDFQSVRCPVIACTVSRCAW
ncbi:hypothetical protein C8Q80DRAFT_1192696 [Daedaleopsis nitida]|nr:hypothetical protein C8Q80DRAFT_1192696 [Daedaleopsis nitida]